MLQKRAGAKGFGLYALEPIVAGQFIIEYIGEVLDEDEYLRRKDFYAEVRRAHGGLGLGRGFGAAAAQPCRGVGAATTWGPVWA